MPGQSRRHLPSDQLGRAGDKRTFVDGQTEQEQLVARVAVLMDNLHLLHDGRLARLARACGTVSGARGRGAGSVPRSKILHSRRKRLASSSSCLSMANERSLSARLGSVAPPVDAELERQAPMVWQRAHERRGETPRPEQRSEEGANARARLLTCRVHFRARSRICAAQADYRCYATENTARTRSQR